jgi:hypothetical protein
MIHAWDNYPLDQFPPLWNWISEEIDSQNLVMSSVAYEEVEHKAPECATWLRENGVTLVIPNDQILLEARRCKQLLGIAGDQYHAKGVDENDLFIIATAKMCGRELVSDEGRQATLPQLAAKRKIPAVCSMTGVRVVCMSFIEYLRRSNRVFG